MPRTARTTLTALLIALHATILLCGPGLHAAPGLAHAGLSNAPATDDGGTRWSETSTRLVDHCPLCEYLAQGQLPLQPAAWIACQLVRPFEPALLPVLSPFLLPFPSRSRAPPRDAAWIV